MIKMLLTLDGRKYKENASMIFAKTNLVERLQKQAERKFIPTSNWKIV